MSHELKYIVEAGYFKRPADSPVNNAKLLMHSPQDGPLPASLQALPLKSGASYRIVDEAEWQAIKKASCSVDMEIARRCGPDGRILEPIEIDVVYVRHSEPVELGTTAQPITLHLTREECVKLNAPPECCTKEVEDPPHISVRIVPRQPEFTKHYLSPTTSLHELRRALPYIVTVYWNKTYFSLALFAGEESEYVSEIFDLQGSERRLLLLEVSDSLPFVRGYGEDVVRRLRSGGINGLTNLGNTCYMNAAIQCLSHCVPLTTWYLSRKYVQDINKDNPLGTGGNLAVNYAHLLCLLWPEGGHGSSVSPMQLKKTVGKYCPLFKGYDQHDSQEFIAYLLDGLHEDCNTVSRKPYVEKPELVIDGNGVITVDGYRKETLVTLVRERNIAELERRVGENSWHGHRLRNESKIVDLFHGMLKSKVQCLECGALSITYDPMMYASLTIPRFRTLALLIAVYVNDFPRPVTMALHIEYREEILFATRSSNDNNLYQQMRTILVHETDQVKSKFAQIVRLAANDGTPIVNALKTYVDNLAIPEWGKAAVRSARSFGREFRRKRTRRQQSYSDENASERSVQGDGCSASFHIISSRLKRNYAENPELARLAILVESEQRRADDAFIFFTVVLPFPIKLLGSSNISLQYNVRVDLQKRLGDVIFGDVLSRACADYVDAIKTCGKNVPSNLAESLCNALKSSMVIQLSKVFAPHEINAHQEVNAPYLRFKGGLIVASNNMDTFKADGQSPKASKISDSPIVLVGVSEEDVHLEDAQLSSIGIRGVLEDFELLNTSRASTALPHLSIAIHDDCGQLANILQDVANMDSPKESIFYPELVNEVSFTQSNESQELLKWMNDSSMHPGIKTWKCLLRQPEGLSMFSIRGGNNNALISPFAASLEPTHTQLIDCLKEYLVEEQLEDTNQWYCPKCKDHVTATKKFDFFRLPEILVIHLKRFQQEGYRFRTKISSLVEFPWKEDEYLDLHDLIGPECVRRHDCRYRLFAICNHFGTLSGGHYTARARSQIDGKWEWVIYDDSRASRLGPEANLDESEIINSSAYVLFYQRVE